MNPAVLVVILLILTSLACASSPPDLLLEINGPLTVSARSRILPGILQRPFVDGWALVIPVQVEKRGSQDVHLQRVEASAVDLATSDVFGPYVIDDLVESSEWRSQGRRSLRLEVGYVPARPQGPVVVRIEVRGVDGDGRVVSGSLKQELPLGS